VAVAGTPTFMAPELFDGVPSSHRSDLYAVGVMFYYLLTARLPYSSDQISHLIKRHRSDPVPDVRAVTAGLPEALQDIIERCMAKRPAGRFDSAAELAEAIEGVIHQLRDTETLIRESVEGINCFVQGARDRFRIVFHLPTERLQEVYVEGNIGPGGERVISVFSVCAPADPRYFEFALRLNDRLSYGSLSIRNVNGEPMFVMTRTFPRDHVCATDIRAALLEIARRSDVVEQQLTNADVF
jgi:eukaryotic-like serine/threonine-protein kinase